MHADGEQLGKISTMIDEGKCKTVVDSTFRMENYEAAFERVHSGRAVGKVVIRVTDE